MWGLLKWEHCGVEEKCFKAFKRPISFPVCSVICSSHSFSLFFLLYLLLACLSSHRLFPIFPDKQKVYRKEKRSFCPYSIHLFQESDDDGVLLPVWNFVKLIISKGVIDSQTAVLWKKKKTQTPKKLWLPGFSFLIWIFTAFSWHLFSYMFPLLFFSLKGRWKPTDYSLSIYSCSVYL